jgi:hypothetical protein
MGAIQISMEMTTAQKRIIARVLLITLPSIAAGVLVVSSCQDTVTGNGGVSDIVFPDSLVSYTRHVEPLFAQTCTTSRCHGGSTPAKGLSLDAPSYTSLMNFQPRLVISKEPSNSLLIQWLDSTFLPVMPMNRPPLTPNQLRGIKKWISEGAQYN